MTLRLQLRTIFPYLVILLIFILVLVIGVPALEQRAVDQAALSGQPVNFRPVTIFTVVTATIGLVGGLGISAVRNRRQIQTLQELTLAARELGEGKFTEISIPENVNAVNELTDLSDALRKTASQTEVQFDALNKERAMLSAVLSQMTDAVLIADTDGHVQLLNHAGEQLFNTTQEKALGRSVVEVMRHHSLVALWEQTLAGNPKTITVEMGAAHKFLQVSGISLGEDLPGRSMLLFQDLTQTHRLEIMRRDFISNISHELRTPMAGLKAISETLLDGALDDPTVARRFVVRMDSEVDNLTQIVNELLELSRIEAGRTNFEFQRVEPCALMSHACERMSLQAERAGLMIITDCPEGLPLIFADPDRISQVFVNLIHNAIKFTQPGGKIWASAWLDNNYVVFRIKDTGVGISAKDLPRIFERFYKADRARSGGGTGLGLSISKHMIEAHNGKIWAESEEGVGSSFLFTIPVASR